MLILFKVTYFTPGYTAKFAPSPILCDIGHPGVHGHLKYFVRHEAVSGSLLFTIVMLSLSDLI